MFLRMKMESCSCNFVRFERTATLARTKREIDKRVLWCGTQRTMARDAVQIKELVYEFRSVLVRFGVFRKENACGWV